MQYLPSENHASMTTSFVLRPATAHREGHCGKRKKPSRTRQNVGPQTGVDGAAPPTKPTKGKLQASQSPNTTTI